MKLHLLSDVAADTPSNMLVLRGLAGGVIAGLLFGIIMAVLDGLSKGLAEGLIFAVIMSVFFVGYLFYMRGRPVHRGM